MARRAKPLTESPTVPAKKRKRKVRRKLTVAARAKRAAQMKVNRKNTEPNVKIALHIQHFVNGITFGPGIVTLKRSLAWQFKGEEERFLQAERDLFTTKSTVIGRPGPTGSYSTHRVPDELFDESLSDPQYVIPVPKPD